MLSKLLEQIREYSLVQQGDHIICAVSGGADSMALLWAFVLLKDKLNIRVSAAHFNHKLRGAESDRDEAFVKNFCAFHDIPLYVGNKEVVSGKKGLEAAAREARYSFFDSLDGKIATAHTADDNAETLLINLIRGTGLRGLGGIQPCRGKIIRPLLRVTRSEIDAFLNENYIDHIEDSSNASDVFLRNRIRHWILPLLEKENPRFSENTTQMAMRLLQDEEYLSTQGQILDCSDVTALRNAPVSIRRRAISRFLIDCGVREPESRHIRQVERLIYSDNPSATACLPNGIVVCRQYLTLGILRLSESEWEIPLPVGTSIDFPDLNLRVTCKVSAEILLHKDCFSVESKGNIVLRSRKQGDSLKLAGGTKSLKKLMIDKKIPASLRGQIPVVADDDGILGVYQIGANLDRIAEKTPNYQISFEQLKIK